jgi:hypothetical protein
LQIVELQRRLLWANDWKLHLSLPAVDFQNYYSLFGQKVNGLKSDVTRLASELRVAGSIRFLSWSSCSSFCGQYLNDPDFCLPYNLASRLSWYGTSELARYCGHAAKLRSSAPFEETRNAWRSGRP